MADTYKLQYNGMTLAYPGWNGYMSWENAEVAYNLYLQQQIGGTITADKLSGMNGEIVTLSNTPDTGYQFNSYGITGAELSGNQFAFDGSDVTALANFEEAVYTLTLQNDGHGTISATTTTGHAGDTVTLSNTYNTYYRFNNYTVTGGTLNGSTFTFGSQNATAKANFKVNAFTATGNFNFSTHTAQGNFSNTYSGYLRAKTGDIPSTWGNVNSVFNPSNASSYLMTISAQPTLWTTSFKADFEGRARRKTTNIKTAKQTVPTSQTAKMNLNCTTTLQGDINIYLYCSAGTTAFRKGWTAMSPNAWTATGYAP